MTEVDERVVRLLHDARHALEEERRRRSEPMAIVGIGCRFPGASASPEQYWQMLRTGVDATGDVPRERWDPDALYDEDPEVPGKAYVKRGAFLEDIAGFEPEFFGISPREAVGLDPQQRLLLEVSWEALEDAGIAPHGLNGSATGVWVGQSLDDYARRAGQSGNLERIDPYSALGTARSVAAGRIAYVLGLHGPVMQVDTSCSSSLVALHLACQSLRAGECDLALVGGVNLIASPETTIALCKLRALSRDGRCKTFDSSADGYGRGEGCGVVVLKRLGDAVAASDRIYAEVRGSALNHDGRSNGLTAPNGAAQEAVLRKALANAKLEAHEVRYIEAHGTGTLLGDPIEVLALNRVFGASRSMAEPLYVGSAKTNIGHLEAAAGIAALIKAALSISHASIPPHLHFRDPNPKIPWRELPLRVPLEATSWPAGASRVAGVSSFGMSGTNAHVVLAQAAEAPPRAEPLRSASLVVLSARTDEALKESAGRLRAHLERQPGLALDEIARTLAIGRSPLNRRVAMVHASRGDLDASLAALAAGHEAPSISRPIEGRGGRPAAWLFPGQGAQALGMGRTLAREFTSFRDGLGEALAALDPHLDRPLESVLWAEPGTAEAALLQQTAYTQPALFASGWAFAALWRSLGVTPGWVGGHSIGELTAACVAEVFSLADGARLVCARGRLMQALPPNGGMLAVELDVDDAARVIERHGDRVAIAAMNSPGSVVLSGDRLALQELAEMLGRVGVAHKALAVSHAFHSPLVEPMLDDFARVASSIEYRAPRVAVVSNVSGELAGPELQTAGYWVRHVREPVRFAAGVRALHAAGARAFFELGPRAVLCPMIEQTLAREDLLLVPSGRAGRSETATLLDAVGACWKDGATIQWRELFAPNTRRCALPTYPWQRKRYWQNLDGPRSAQTATLLGAKVVSASGDVLFESEWSSTSPAWVADHRLGERVVMPGAAFVELVRAAAASLHGASAPVYSLSLEKALVLRAEEPCRVQVLARKGGRQLGVYSRASSDDEDAWTLHATAQLDGQDPRAPSDDPPVVDLEELSVPDFYASLASIGLNYGPSFRVIERLWKGEHEASAELRLPEELEAGSYGLHPALLDAAFQLAAAIGAEPLETAYVPVEVHGFRLRRRGSALAKARAWRAGPPEPDTMSVSVAISDGRGPLASIERVVFRRVPIEGAARGDHLYELRWRAAKAPPATAAGGSWTFVETPCGAKLGWLARLLRERGAACTLSAEGTLPEVTSGGHVVCFWDRDGSVDAALEMANEAVELAQRLLSGGKRPRLWWLTRNAVSILPHEVPQPSLAAIWGLGRTLMLEHPELACTLIDVDDAANLADVLSSESGASDNENQLAWRGAERYALRLTRSTSEAPPSPRPLRTDGTVFITGGLGALGLEAARTLAQRGVKHIVLASRRRPDSAGLAGQVEELQQLGTRVSIVEVDVRNLDEMRRVMSEVSKEAPLRGVIHAAGVLDDGVWLEQTRSRLEGVMTPKVIGAWNLHRVTRDADLDLFVMFSSLAGTLGSAGQAGYAAANACLDALADHRRALGLPAQSLAFGPWEVGLAAKLSSQQRDRLIRQGIGFLSPERGRAALDRALGRPEAALVVADLRPAVAAQSFAHSLPGLWRELLPARDVDGASKRDWRTELDELSNDSARLERLTRLVAEEVGRVLSIAREENIPERQPLGDLGMDSLMTLELRRELSRRSGVALTGLDVTSRSTLGALASSLLVAMQRGLAQAHDHERVAVGRCSNTLSQPKARLFCFHYAGGSADIFEPFDALATLGIEVHTISHTRGRPASKETSQRFLAEASGYIAEHSDVPYAIFGHSLGGLIALRVLEELLDRRVAAPRLFIPSAAAFPEGLAGDFSREALTRAFLRIVGDRAVASESLLEDFIADSELWRQLPPKPPQRLAVSIAAFVGAADHIATEPAMREWAERTSSRFTLTAVAGGHFYLSEPGPRREVLAELARQLLE